MNPYSLGTNLQKIQQHFSYIQVGESLLKARGDKAALEGEKTKKIPLSRFSAQFTTFNTGGSLISTPEEAAPGSSTFPNQLGN